MHLSKLNAEKITCLEEKKRFLKIIIKTQQQQNNKHITKGKRPTFIF